MKNLVIFDMDETLISSQFVHNKYCSLDQYEELNLKFVKCIGENFKYNCYVVDWFENLKMELKEMGIPTKVMTFGMMDYATLILEQAPFCFDYDNIIACDHLTGNKEHRDFKVTQTSAILTPDTVKVNYYGGVYDNIIMIDNATKEFNALKMVVLEKMCKNLIYVETKDFDMQKMAKKSYYKAQDLRVLPQTLLKAKIEEVNDHNLKLIHTALDSL